MDTRRSKVNTVEASAVDSYAVELAWAGGFAAAWMIFYSIYNLQSWLFHDKPSAFVLALVVSLVTLHGVRTMIERAAKPDVCGCPDAQRKK